jgi:hypothetical protein
MQWFADGVRMLDRPLLVPSLSPLRLTLTAGSRTENYHLALI